MPNRPSFTTALILLLLGFILPLGADTKRPNILYLMADNHTWQAIGSYGSRLKEFCPTPNIDRLANEGMLFKNVYCTNSICTPSRASILSGQYSHKNGLMTLVDT